MLESAGTIELPPRRGAPSTVLIVVDQPKAWPFEAIALESEGVELVASRRYLTDGRFSALPRTKVLNLCRSYRYQSFGYYVSLLATARGHRPIPSIETIQDLKLPSIVKVAASELADAVERSLAGVEGSKHELTLHFGRATDPRFDRLGAAIFGRFPAPFLRVAFARNGHWTLDGLRVVGASDVPDADRPFVLQQAKRFFERPPRSRRPRSTPRFELAILRDEKEAMPPSNERALRRFMQAANALGIRAEFIGRDDYGRLAEFDALFIRETTAVNHHTYRFARRAAAEGLVVIDDPESIVRCGNKVYLAEILAKHRLATPRTVVISRDTATLVETEIGFPCVIKQPDSSFSRGVVKFDTKREFEAAVPNLFENSDLLIAQAFVPTEFDWRIGVLDGQPLFACRYFMARKHWQIVKREGSRVEPGNADTVPVDKAPASVVSLAVKAARLIGDGLYGVDLKVLDGKPVVIEINDNPNIDGGIEDAILGDFLYETILRDFADRVEAQRRSPA
ncbi:MAG: RimK family protein [Phycisphaerales bacterium]